MAAQIAILISTGTKIPFRSIIEAVSKLYLYNLKTDQLKSVQEKRKGERESVCVCVCWVVVNMIWIMCIPALPSLPTFQFNGYNYGPGMDAVDAYMMFPPCLESR